jgi:hypothetical protein
MVDELDLQLFPQSLSSLNDVAHLYFIVWSSLEGRKQPAHRLPGYIPVGRPC